MKAQVNKNKDAQQQATLKKLLPKAKVPVASSLRRLTEDEVTRLENLLVEPLECVFEPSFRTASAERELTHVEPLANPAAAAGYLHGSDERTARRKRSLPRGLTREQEVRYFRTFNYARFRMMKILRSAGGRRLSLRAARELLEWDARACAARDVIVQANLGLVPTMIERSRITGLDFSELISEGQLALLRSVSKFDCTRGFKFSTYACRAILSSISRSVALTVRHRTHFPTEYDPDLQKSDELERRRESVEDDFVEQLNRILAANLAELTDAEKRVLSARFGVGSGTSKTSQPPKTLRQVAALFGVTKERVRQIQNKALTKLRSVLEDRVFAA